jgi:hypothetical protein
MDLTDLGFCNVDWMELAPDRSSDGAETSIVTQHRPNSIKDTR